MSYANDKTERDHFYVFVRFRLGSQKTHEKKIRCKIVFKQFWFATVNREICENLTQFYTKYKHRTTD